MNEKEFKESYEKLSPNRKKIIDLFQEDPALKGKLSIKQICVKIGITDQSYFEGFREDKNLNDCFRYIQNHALSQVRTKEDVQEILRNLVFQAKNGDVDAVKVLKSVVPEFFMIEDETQNAVKMISKDDLESCNSLILQELATRK